MEQNEKKNWAAEKIASSIIDKIKKNKIESWSWFFEGLPAISYKTGKYYTGINEIVLNNPYGTGEYITFKEVQQHKNAKIKKGAKASYAVYYSSSYKLNPGDEGYDEDKAAKAYRFMKAYPVFDLADVEGIEPRKREPLKENTDFKISKCEKLAKALLKKYEIKVEHSATKPSLIRKVLTIPEKKQYTSPACYYFDMFRALAKYIGQELGLIGDCFSANIIADIAVCCLRKKLNMPADAETVAAYDINQNIKAMWNTIDTYKESLVGDISKGEKIAVSMLEEGEKESEKKAVKAEVKEETTVEKEKKEEEKEQTDIEKVIDEELKTRVKNDGWLKEHVRVASTPKTVNKEKKEPEQKKETKKAGADKKNAGKPSKIEWIIN